MLCIVCAMVSLYQILTIFIIDMPPCRAPRPSPCQHLELVDRFFGDDRLFQKTDNAHNAHGPLNQNHMVMEQFNKRKPPPFKGGPNSSLS